MINNDYSGERATPETESRYIWRPDQNKCGYNYAHHPFLTFFAGRYYAAFSNGVELEDRPYQRVVLLTSDDYVKWSEPFILFDTLLNTANPGVFTPGGFHIYDGMLVAYAGYFEFDEQSYQSGDFKSKPHANARLFARTTRDGVNWSEYIDIGIPVLPNHGPEKLRGGRLMMCGNFSFPYTDDPTGLTGWQIGGVYPYMRENYFDTPYGHRLNTEILKCGTALCEGSFFQDDNGIIHMLMRSLSSYLWESVSYDNGVNWSYPKETRFTDCSSKFHFGRCEKGIFVVSTPDREQRRTPLVLSFTQNGQDFDRQYVIGATGPTDFDPALNKSIKAYGYPHVLVHEGYINVITSICKYCVMVHRVRIKDL